VDKFLSDLGLSESSCILDFAFRRLKQNFGGNSSPLVIVNCNENNLGRIQEYLKSNKYYGLNPAKIRFFSTNCLPVINHQGKYCVNQKLRLIRRPAGTATCAEFLLNSKMQELFSSEGIEYVYFSGMENLLENPCDPLLLGMIKTEKRKIAAKCVSSSFYSEPLPRYCSRDTKTKVELLSNWLLK
jgi:UDP-N-acetylglucosamine pyrophosphorylase